MSAFGGKADIIQTSATQEFCNANWPRKPIPSAADPCCNCIIGSIVGVVLILRPAMRRRDFIKFIGGGVFSFTEAIGHSQVNTGWVAGYGTEGRLPGMPGWTWKVEGLYMDLGTLDATSVTSRVSLGGGFTALTGEQITTHTHFTDGTFAAG